MAVFPSVTVGLKIWALVLIMKILKFWKSSQQVFICSVRRVFCQNFNPPSLFWKNDLEISKIDLLTLKKLKFWKNLKQLVICSIRTVLSKFQPSTIILKKITLKCSKIDPLTLKKLKFWKNSKQGNLGDMRKIHVTQQFFKASEPQGHFFEKTKNMFLDIV